MSGNCKDEMKKKPVATDEPVDLAQVRTKLATLKGKQYWRSLEELSATPAFQDMLHREFPRHAAVWDDGVSRRNFLQLMGASLALAGLSGCTKQPPENIIPYVRQPEEIIPGKPLYFASAMPLGETAFPILVKSEMGRPIKVEGNPDHPAGNLGTDVFSQAAMLEMYDPDRSQNVTELGEVRSWGMFMSAMQPALNGQRAKKGAGLRFLTGAFTSPTLAAQMSAALKAFPAAKWHQYEAVNRDSARAGAQMAFGQPLDTQYRFENASVIVSLDCDFLSSANNPGFLKYSREFAKRKKADQGRNMNRLYVVESTLTPTGAKADNRLPLRASEIEGFARAIAGQSGAGASGAMDNRYAMYANALIKDLQKSRGSSLVMAGESQPPAVHALVHAINQSLGNVGKTVVYTDPVGVTPPNFQGSVQSLSELAADIRNNKVEMLVIFGCNPCYTAPDDLDFRHSDDPENGGRYKRYSILDQVPLRVHLGLYRDETADICHWHINEAHFLESWSDVRTFESTPSIVQPSIDPLYDGKSAHELVGLFTDQPGQSSYDYVRNYWKSQHSGADFENFWRKSVHDGFVANAAPQPKAASAKPANAPAANPVVAGFEMVFRPDPNLHDGRFANNAWLQELPKPISSITWDNAAYISLNDADRLKIASGDVVLLEVQGRKLEAAAWIVPGQPDSSITIHLGYGRTHSGRTGNAHGYNAYLLRTAVAPVVAMGASEPVNTGKKVELAAVHLHHNVGFDTFETKGSDEEGSRGIIRSATLDEYEKNAMFAHKEFEEPDRAFTMYKNNQHPYDPQATPHAWGMSIDLNACIGCNTCVVACQSENNIPVVGKFEVRRGREMHWIRIDNYFRGDYANPKTHFQPVTCMQCENAPCEVVCPVGATVHSTEGLNDMVYNRCVGTRYCSNNCPYKVRRFNFMLYADFKTPQFKLMNNPDVTVRSRGVMEKCTYCIQRINRGRIAAEEANRLVADGEVKTACQQACPTDAIVFGNINDPQSRIAKLKAEPLNYGMLAELNTRPRTTYLAEVTNPNPDLMDMEHMIEQQHVLGRGHGEKE